MNFSRIRHFVSVAEARSLTKAAERLHIVQPAISQSIKKLEEEMGVSLFTRSRRGMELTEAGTVFLDSAYGILNQFNRAKENVAAVGRETKGTVSMAMTASTLNVLSVPVCELLQATHPEVALNLEEGLTGNIELGFEAGWYDLVIVSNPQPDPSVHAEELITEDLYLVTPFDTKAPSRVRFDHIQEHPVIIPKSKDSIGNTLEEYARGSHVSLQASKITAALHPALLLVEAGLGHTIMPWSAIFDRVEAQRVSARKIFAPNLRRRVSMLYPTQRPLTQASIAVMEVIRQAVRKVHSEDRWRGELVM